MIEWIVGGIGIYIGMIVAPMAIGLLVVAIVFLMYLVAFGVDSLREWLRNDK